MTDRKDMEIWFVAGSQHLYGSEVLKAVEDHCAEIVKYLNEQGLIIPVRNKAVLTTSEAISTLCHQANSDNNCIGIIVWMHTFSPAKMWIKGLKHLRKPLLHLHTQFNRDIPWDTIDMDFMNLNQSAHGGREFGFISTRLHRRRKVVAGFWKDNAVIDRLKIWARVCAAWADMQELKIARIGDNMRNVAVTEGNQVSAELTFGFSTNGYGLGDVVKYIDEVTPKSIDHLVEQYLSEYSVAEALLPGNIRHASLRDAAQIELGLRNFLEDGSFLALTDTFENLHGLKQLPGISIQRLMADGYGFGAEGDWKTAALVRCLKVMGTGLPGGESFMEDYTYNLSTGSQYVLGAHMLEICPTLTVDKPACEIHPLGIGGRDDPVRLVFNGTPGPAINVSLIDLGHRFRLLVNTVTAVEIPTMPNLPVARVLWKPDPDLSVAATAWILAGGAHHTCFSQSLTLEFIEDFAEIADIELVCIDSQTEIRRFKQDLRLGEAGYWSG